MSEKQNQYKSKHGPKINLPGLVKNQFMGKGNGEFRRMWANAIAYSNNGWKNVAAQDANKASARGKSRNNAANEISEVIAGK